MNGLKTNLLHKFKKQLINYYLNKYSKDKYTKRNKSLRQLRDKSISLFEKNVIKFRTNHEWKNTDFSSIFNYHIGNEIIKTRIKLQEIYSSLYKFSSYILVFIDCMTVPILSKKSSKEIYLLSNLFYLKKYNYIIENYYGKIVSTEDSLSNLNTALAQDGSYISITDNFLLEKPIQIIYFTTGSNLQDTLFFTRNLIILGKKARGKIIEYHQSLYIHNYINISVTEIYSKNNSYFEYFKIQNDISKSSLIDKTFVKQDGSSFFEMNTFSFNGNIVRNHLRFHHCGERIISHLNGLTIIEKKSLVDHNISIDHTSQNCKSYELYKGVFGVKSKGIFNGKIIVRKNSNKIDAYQRNDKILLSKESFLNSNPILNIFSKEVKCSHACTLGLLDEMSLFYFKSRGIAEKEALIYLILAFVCEILENLHFVQMKKIIYHIILEKFQVYFGLTLYKYQNVISKRYL